MAALDHGVPELEVIEKSVLVTACYLFTEITCETQATTRTMSGYVYLSRG